MVRSPRAPWLRISLRGLAKAVHHDPSYLSKALRGLKPCGPRLARDIDNALAAEGEIIQAASRRERSAPQEAPVAPEVVDYFRAQLAGHYTVDMYLGPRHLVPTVQTQAELIIRLAASADAPVRRGLLDTGAAYAALLGWLYQDAGDLAASARWRDATLSLAHRSGDPQLISYALTNKAMLALDLDDGAAVVDYARAALASERELTAKARLLAIQHQAQGHAMLGDRTTADRLMDQATALVNRVDDEYPWGNSSRRTRTTSRSSAPRATGAPGARRTPPTPPSSGTRSWMPCPRVPAGTTPYSGHASPPPSPRCPTQTEPSGPHPRRLARWAPPGRQDWSAN